MKQYKLLDRSRDNQLTNKEIEELRGICYDKGCSVYPIDAFFNDIERNQEPRFRKDLAFKDLWLIIGEYEEVVNKSQLLKLIKETVMPLVNVKEEDWYVWDNGFRTGEVAHKYLVYDSEEYEHIELTKEQFEMLKAFMEGMLI